MLLLLFVNNESESSESPFIQTFLDVPKIKGFFSKTKLNDNDKPSDPAKNNNYMCDNQVYDLISETEPIKMFIKEQLYVIKKAFPTFKPIGTTKQRSYRTSSRTK